MNEESRHGANSPARPLARSPVRPLAHPPAPSLALFALEFEARARAREQQLAPVFLVIGGHLKSRAFSRSSQHRLINVAIVCARL